MTDKIKPGDTIRNAASPRGADAPEYKVLAVDDEGVYAWLQRKNSHAALPFTGILKSYVKIEPFFKEGKTYERAVDWSVHAQRRDVTERFTVESVREDGDGTMSAFGKLELLDLYNGLPINHDRWALTRRYDYRKGGWEEV